MPKKCNVFGCRGNYRCEPYTKVVQFPCDGDELDRWIDVMPNESSSTSSAPVAALVAFTQKKINLISLLRD